MLRMLMTLAFTLLLCLVAGAGLYLFMDSLSSPARPDLTMAGSPTSGAAHPAASAIVPTIVFDPPAPEAAPPAIRDAVMLGYNILMDTHRYAGQYVGNDLQCRSCHFNAGRERNTLSLVGVAAKYPAFRSREHYATDLVTRTQSCFERSMNGHAPPPDGELMQAMMAYYHWISKGVPIYAEIPWLGLRRFTSDHAPDAAAGHQVFEQVCARCHGPAGLGGEIAPPLWGDKSFNDGAGMAKPENFAAFSFSFMPKNAPTLTHEQALDVAAYAATQPRPHFAD